MPEKPIVCAAVEEELKIELDMIAREYQLTRSAVMAAFLRHAVRVHRDEKRSRFEEVRG